MSELQKETDRAAVVLGASKLDLQLYQLLQKVLLACPSGQDELLDNEGGLSTFSAKIHLAHRLGLITSEFARALHLVRKIRNSFAHELGASSLALGEHRNRVRELIQPFLRDPNYEFQMNLISNGKISPSVDFKYALTVLTLQLEVAIAKHNSVSSLYAVPLVSDVKKRNDKNKKK